MPALMLDNRGLITTVNKSFCKLTGLVSGNFTGKKSHEIMSGKKFPPLPKILQHLNHFPFFAGEVKIQQKNNETSVLNTIIFKKETRLCCLFCKWEDTLKLMKEIEILNSIADHNLKKLIKSNEKLQVARQSEKEALSSKEKFLTNVSHELRTPLTGISGIIQLLANTKLDTTQKEYVNSISHSAKNLISMINELLDLSKLKSGKFELNNTEFSLEDCINYTASSFSIISSNSNIHFSLTFDNKIPRILIGDSLRISQILNNLLQNAFKFTNKGFVYLEVKQKEKKEKNTWIEFTVTDTGTGIEKEKLSRIFDEFYQVESASINRSGGTGLGLSICKQLVRLQNGSIDVESEPGKGTRFRVTIPFREGTVPLKKLKPGKKRLNKYIVMVVDDNPVNLLVMENVLKREGAEVLVCKNGREALYAFEKKKADAILVDLNMPIMGGFEFAEKIQEISPAPLMAVTAENQENLSEKCKNSGFMDILLKPFSNDELIEKTLRLLKISGQQKKNIPRKKTPFAKTQNAKIQLQLIESISGNSKNSFNQLIKTIIENLETDIPLLKESIEQKNFIQIKFLAHKLKTSYGYLNLKEEQNKLIGIEEWATEKNDIQTIKRNFEAIFLDHANLIQSLKNCYRR